MKLYTRNTTVDVMRVDNVRFQNIATENSPMNRNVIKLHRGVDNEIRFRVFNQDRKPVDVNHLDIVAVMTNAETGERVLTRGLTRSTQRGFAQLRVTEGDLVRIAPGHYNLVILGEQSLVPGLDPEVYRTPFYTDIGDNIVCTVEVLASADPPPRPSFIITDDDWRVVKQPSGFWDDIDEHRTSAIPASRVRNHINGLHTMAVFTSGYSGTLQVFASLDLQPPEDLRRWFPVNITSGTNIMEFNNYTGSISFTFTANFMWLTFVKRPGWFPADSVFRFPSVANTNGTVALLDNSAIDFVFEGITNPGGYTLATNLLALNKNFLQHETRAWVEQTFPGLMTPQQKNLCNRDVGLIVDGLARDLTVGGYPGARNTAEAYFNNGNPILPPGQESPTAKTFLYLEKLAADVIRNVRVRNTVLDRVAPRFNNVINPGGFTGAAQLLRANREFFKADIKAWAIRRFPSLMSWDQAGLCDRDVGLVVDGLATDLETGGFAETKRAADAYFQNAAPVLPAGQKSPTAQTYMQLLRLAERVIRNKKLFNTPGRDDSGNPLGPIPSPINRLPAQDPVQRFFRGVVNPGGHSDAADLLEASRGALQSTIAAWVTAQFQQLMTPQQEAMCNRDVGLVIDALVHDLRAGGYQETKRGAEFYFRAGDLVLPPGQKSPTAASFDQLVVEIRMLFSQSPVVNDAEVGPVVEDLIAGLTTTIRDPYRGTADRLFDGVTVTAYPAAAALIAAHRAVLQAEVREWVETTFPDLMTPQQIDLCERDVGLVIDGLVQDLEQGHFLGSKLSAGFYLNFGDPVLPANQESPSVQTFLRLAQGIRTLIEADVTVDNPAADQVDTLIERINLAITDPFPDLIAPRFDWINNPGGYLESAAIIADSREALQIMTREWVRNEFPDLMTPQQIDQCEHDVGLIIDGLVTDLIEGGATQAIRAGRKYWADGDLVLPVALKSPTAETFRFLEESIARLLNSAQLTTDDPQEVDNVIRKLISGVNAVITDPFRNPLLPAFEPTGRPRAAALIARNRLFLQAEVREWMIREFPGLLNVRQEDQRDRDVGMVIQSIVRDLETGGASESLRVARSYLTEDGASILPVGQKEPIALTFEYLRHVIKRVIRNEVVPATQRRSSQVLQSHLMDTAPQEVDVILDRLIGGITAVLRKPTEIALSLAGIFNPGGFNEAALLLAANRTTLQATVRSWVEAQFPGLMNASQRDLCDRDVGLIIDALAADLSHGGTNGARRAALAYYNNGVPVLPTNQRSPTAQAFERLVAEVHVLFGGALTTDDPEVTGRVVTQLVDGINRIIRNPLGAPGRVTLAFSGIEQKNPGGHSLAAQKLIDNRSTLQATTRDWVLQEFPNLMTPQQSDLYDRGVGLVIDGLTVDLQNGGVAGTRRGAIFYFNDGLPVLPAEQKSPTAAAYRFLVEQIRVLFGTEVPQPQADEASNIVVILIDALNDVITDPFRDPTALLFDTRKAAELLRLNRAYLQEEIREWIGINYPTLMTPAQEAQCDRDVGLIVDGFVEDLTRGGSVHSLRAAESYFNFGHPVLPEGPINGQAFPTAASFVYLATVADAVIRQDNWNINNPNQVYRPSWVIAVESADLIQRKLDNWVSGINDAIIDPPQLIMPFTRQVRRDITVINPETVDTAMGTLVSALNSVIQDPPFLQVTTSTPEPAADDAQDVIHAHIEAVNRVIVTPPVAPIIPNTVVNPVFQDINNPGGFDNAADLIMANLSFIQAELRTWIQRVNPSLMTARQAVLCNRDVRLIVESLARPSNVAKPQGDLRAGGSAEMLRSAQAYFNQGTPQLPPGQESPTVQMYKRLAQLTRDIIRNRPVINPEQTQTPQVYIDRLRVWDAHQIDSVVDALIDALNHVISSSADGRVTQESPGTIRKIIVR